MVFSFVYLKVLTQNLSNQPLPKYHEHLRAPRCSTPDLTRVPAIPLGPKLFREPSSKSNKPIIHNAVSHCCLAGKVNEPHKNSILEVSVTCPRSSGNQGSEHEVLPEGASW